MGTPTENEVQLLRDEIKTLTKQLDEKSPEAIYSITVDGSGRAMVTVRSRPGERGESYLARLTEMLNKIELMGYKVRPEPKVVNELPPQVQPQPATNGNGNGNSATPANAGQPLAPQATAQTMAIAEARIVSDRNGLPQLELYQNGHQYPDLRYSFGKDLPTRQQRIAQMIGTNPDAITIGWKSSVNWVATWQTGRDPKYKDLVAIAK